MRRLSVIFLIVPCFFFLSVGESFSIPLDITNSGMEVTAPNEFILHNAISGSKMYYGVFQWNPSSNVFAPTGSGMQSPVLKFWEYFPLHLGDTWTYRRHDGSADIRTVTAVEDVCGMPCMKLEGSNGINLWWASDSSGIWLAKAEIVGYQTTIFCPLKICNPYTYLGFSKLTPFEDVPIYDGAGIFMGTMSGYHCYSGNSLETVVTPAGVFPDAVRTNWVFSWTDPWGTCVRTHEFWSVKGIGTVKRVTAESDSSGGALIRTHNEVVVLESATVGGVSYP
ncbi:MAG: hypothetical protein C4520_06845 [Candidatus Abyssobacteria bacterium SURF_5]|uniref:Uncharacterized protein n=1 Tax=Abyssobacteria bacterium (strain SURF_5) TaxID=2093360 RepID=A0A3A4NX31_ABYX5|nr:MAG: hypothetical protein C4520_06845 [Candidatus Abyssubacteria bacterium SURF_5]